MVPAVGGSGGGRWVGGLWTRLWECRARGVRREQVWVHSVGPRVAATTITVTLAWPYVLRGAERHSGG